MLVKVTWREELASVRASLDERIREVSGIRGEHEDVANQIKIDARNSVNDTDFSLDNLRNLPELISDLILRHAMNRLAAMEERDNLTDEERFEFISQIVNEVDRLEDDGHELEDAVEEVSSAVSNMVDCYNNVLDELEVSMDGGV